MAASGSLMSLTLEGTKLFHGRNGMDFRRMKGYESRSFLVGVKEEFGRLE